MATDSGSTFTFPFAGDLMVLDTPLLRVSRPVAACSRCRAAKVKCDGKLPACTACEKSNKAAECSSTNDQFARGKERSYVATLENRVERLERKIAEARARRKSSNLLMTDVDDSATPRKLSVDMLSVRQAQNGRAARRKEASDIDNLVSDFGLLAVNATARDYHGFTSAMSYARLVLSACTKEPLPSGLSKTLPPRYSAMPLIQNYINNVFIILPVFDEANFYASVDAVYSPDRGKPGALDFWMVRMVLALASIAFSQQRGDSHYFDAVGHVSAALEYAEEVLHPGQSTTIQALVLLVEFAMMDPHHFDSWNLIGAASRAMVDIGMHQDPSKIHRSTKGILDMKRRIYWCVYALDRSTSLVQTRAFSFSDDSANVALPFTAITSSSKPNQKSLWGQTNDTALELFKIRQIQSSWYAELFQSGRDPWPDPYNYIWKTYREITDWYNNAYKTSVLNTQAFFELEVLYSYVYVLSPSPRCPSISNYAQRLIFEHCIAYAISLRAILKDSSSLTSRIPLSFYDAMRAYMTGRQFVDVLQRNADILLSPVPPTPPASSASAPPPDSIDPFAAPLEENPPPFPAPVLPPLNAGALPSTDPPARALRAINDFTDILAIFGMRFGYINWRDRFTKESAAVTQQLYTRASASPPPPPTTNPNTSPVYAPSLPPPSGPPPSTHYATSPQRPVYPGYAPHHMPPNPPPAPFGWTSAPQQMGTSGVGVSPVYAYNQDGSGVGPGAGSVRWDSGMQGDGNRFG